MYAARIGEAGDDLIIDFPQLRVRNSENVARAMQNLRMAVSHPANRFLQSLPTRDYELLRPHLASVQLEQYAVLFSDDTKITRAYFPYDCLISLLAPLPDGETAAVAAVGREGVVGSSAALGASHSINDAVVSIPGLAAAIDIAALSEAAKDSIGLRQWLFRHCHFKRALAQQGAVCLAKHSICARLCRFLTRIYDLTGRTEFPMTHEFLAQLLGVQRVSVTLAAERLRQAGLIAYRRGHIRIVTLPAVERAACECYKANNEKRTMLLEPAVQSSNGDRSRAGVVERV